MSELVDRFARDLAEVSWRDLRIHLQRDAIITLTKDLSLIEVAMAVAKDQKSQVESWVTAGKLSKPSELDVQTWEGELDKPFRMLIVQPFILIQAVFDA